MGNPVVHFEIMGRDAARLRAFYSGLFGWTIKPEDPAEYGFVDTRSDGRGINGGILSKGQAGGVTVYVAVADVQATLDRIAAAGGKTVVPVTDIPGVVRFALFADPEGNCVGLVAETPPLV